MSSVQAKSFNSDSARNEALRYKPPIRLNQITTRTGKATVIEVKMAALKHGIPLKSRAAPKATKAKPKATRAAPKATRAAPTATPKATRAAPTATPKATATASPFSSRFYIIPQRDWEINNNQENAKFLAKWYNSTPSVWKPHGTSITHIQFTPHEYYGIWGVKVEVDYTDPDPDELGLIKDVFTEWLSGDDTKIVLINNGMLVHEPPGKESWVEVRPMD